jgi:hypothetical protein
VRSGWRGSCSGPPAWIVVQGLLLADDVGAELGLEFAMSGVSKGMMMGVAELLGLR